MAVVPKSEDVSKVLVRFREPADMTLLVNKTSDNLLDLSMFYIYFISQLNIYL